MSVRDPLPIDAVLPSIVEAVAQSGRVVVVAPPGAGKSTRVPAALLEGEAIRGPGAIWMLQPRRIAARAVADRIARERGGELGAEVGYQVRLEKRVSRDTRLIVMTEGILTRRMLDDPYLDGVSAVILDEFHERSIHTDLGLAMLREVRQTVRDDLGIVVMSATMDAEAVAQFLDGAPIVRCEGRTFPVELRHRPPEDVRVPLAERVEHAVREVLREDSAGDLLVFLPGVGEIHATARRIAGLSAEAGLEVVPLHGQIGLEDQARALTRGPRRRIVLATNVAETSLTVEGVTTVIDSGLVRRLEFDPSRGLERLVLGRASLASCEQRAGRAGRLEPGLCMRLWDAREDRGRDHQEPPEVARIDLASPLLTIRAWGATDPAAFGWFERPGADRLASAQRLLTSLGAIDSSSGLLTDSGRRILALPVHPRLGRLLVESRGTGLEHAAATVAALLSERDLFPPVDDAPTHASARPSVHASSDLQPRLDALESFERGTSWPGPRVDASLARRVLRNRDQLLRLVERLPRGGVSIINTLSPDSDERLRALVFLAYPDRLVRRRPDDPLAGRMIGGRGVRLDPRSVVRDAELFVALEARDTKRSGRTEVRVRLASAVRRDWLERLVPESIRSVRDTKLDGPHGRPRAREAVCYLDLPLEEARSVELDPTQAARILTEHARGMGPSLIRANELASRWLARLEFLREALGEFEWPEFGDSELGELAFTAATGCATLRDLEQCDWVPWLESRLTREQVRLLESEAPERIALPTGRASRLDYQAVARDAARCAAPRLSARVQELFGWRDTPRLARGRVAVLLEIQGPNHRPVQLTSDLRSFWQNTYPQVRKDLRARYPKHSWPEDPLSAQPEDRPRRRGASG
jgi:ATP-dependent helicase HrpB